MNVKHLESFDFELRGTGIDHDFTSIVFLTFSEIPSPEFRIKTIIFGKFVLLCDVSYPCVRIN